jgi:hypothetical protein
LTTRHAFQPDHLREPCRILITDETLAVLDDAFECEHVGNLSLEGKAKRVGVRRVVGRAASHRRHPTTHEGRELGSPRRSEPLSRYSTE